MASQITSAGSASGMDFESIIAASVQAKASQINRNVIKKKEETSITLSGVGKLKSALEEFQKSIKALTEDNGFNTRKVTTDLPTENPYFTVSTKDDASNGEYDITVTQVAKNEKLEQVFKDSDKFGKGKLTITLPGVKDETGKVGPERKIEIDVAADDNIHSIRRKINENDLGVSATTVTLANGDTKLVIDSGVSGDKGNIKMDFSGDSAAGSDKFKGVNSDTDKKGWNVTQGQNAKITVDGQDLESQTNEFRDAISGITIDVHRESKKDDKGTGYISNNVKITADTEKVTEKMQAFVTAYNTLMDTMGALYEHNTYTDGNNNYDGGQLAGDSMLRGLQSQIQNMMTNVSANSSGLNIYDIGIKIDKEGKMSLDSTKFKENIADNFNAVVKIFSSDEKDKNGNKVGILAQLKDTVDSYTKSDGLLKKREDDLNAQIKDYEADLTKNDAYIAEYEASLRQKYARLDTTIAGYNQSLNYLVSAMG